MGERGVAGKGNRSGITAKQLHNKAGGRALRTPGTRKPKFLTLKGQGFQGAIWMIFCRFLGSESCGHSSLCALGTLPPASLRAPPTLKP